MTIRWLELLELLSGPNTSYINFVGTVFEIGSRRMEIYAVHHARATIQWLKASKDNSVQAEMLLKNIYVN